MSGNGAFPRKPWWQQEGTIILALVLVFPLGVFLMWLYAPWRRGLKWILTGIAALAALVILVIAFPEKESDVGLSSGHCSGKDARAAIAAMAPLAQEYFDNYDRANSASRIALSPVIGDMQGTRRKLSSLDIPDCAAPVRVSLVSAMDETINAFLAFQGQEIDSVVASHMTKAAKLLDESTVKLGGLKIDAASY